MVHDRRRFLLSAAAASAACAARPAFAFARPRSYSAAVQAQLARVDAGPRGPFHPDWDSLAAYRTPDWFRDAKFGIFIHWGVYSVPAFQNEWYSRNMYQQGSAAYTYHRAVYGPQSRFGYKDFIPRFRAERFAPGAWVELFEAAGAKYVVPVGEHCDGFPMYDCGFTDWSAAKMGPKRDVVGDLAQAVRARGLRLGVSSHRAEHWFWFDGGRRFDSDVNDPRWAGLYGPARPEPLPADSPTSSPDPSHLEMWLPPDKPFMDDWLARTSEIVDKYRPDLIYLDWWTSAPLLEPYLQRLAAYYYNQSAARGQGSVLTYKGENFAPGTALFDVERGKLDTLRLTPWQTDTSVSIHSWGYAQDDSYRTPTSLIQELVDVVSKNGNLLLNVGPKSDGTIPEQAATVLRGIGAWLKVNGEAIYESRPWSIYGEGTTYTVTGEKKEAAQPAYKADDLRFTRRGETLYVTALNPSPDGRILVKTLYGGTPYLVGPMQEVALVGSAEPVKWEQSAIGLAVQLPAQQKPGEPVVLRMKLPAGQPA